MGWVFTLTNGTDTATANVFNAGLVYVPGGNDRINALQDEDVLTGTGTKPTLNATLGNANDNGGTVVTPKLSGIETINVGFTGSGATAANQLDLQDSANTGKEINITRISDGIATATIDNISVASEKLSVSNSGQPGQNVGFLFKDAVITGNNDATTVTVKDVQLGNLAVQSRNATPGVGFETINLVSSTDANTIGQLSAEDLSTLNISGDANLTLGTTAAVTGAQGVEATRYTAGLNNVTGSLTVVNAAELTGALDYTIGGEINGNLDNTSGTAVNLTVTGGKAADTFRLAPGVSVNATDVIAGGEGNDTLVMFGGASAVAAGTSANVRSVEALQVLTGHDDGRAAEAVTINAAAFDSLATIFVRNEGQSDMTDANADGIDDLLLGFATTNGVFNSAAEVSNVTLNNLNATQAAGITVAHGTTGNNGLVQNVLNVNLQTATGTNDTVAVTLVNGVNNDQQFNLTLNAGGATAATGVENVTLTDNDTESNTVALGSVANHTGTITLAGGQTGQYMNLDARSGGNAADGGYGYATTGAATSATTVAASMTTAPNPLYGANFATTSIRDTAVASVLNTVVGDQALVATAINSTAYAGDAVVRVGTANQAIRFGAGNDTVIFADRAGITAGTAGLTITDTVAGGAGSDTVVFDGTGVQTLGNSEWTNMTGIDTLRVAGVAASTFTIRVTDQLIDQTDSGSVLNIVNNDGLLNNAAENVLTVNMRGVSATNFLNFTGANGDGGAAQAGRAVQTIVLDNTTANGGSTLNGGDRDAVSTYIQGGASNAVSTGGSVAFANTAAGQAAADAAYAAAVAAGRDGNNNVLQVFNNAEVTVGDLANVSNFSTIQGRSDLTSAQRLTLTLDNTTVDRLVDSNHTANSTARETITVQVLDNQRSSAGLVANNSNIMGLQDLTLEASTLSNSFNVNVTAGRGTHNIVTGAGNDTITLLGNFTAAEAAARGYAAAVAGQENNVTLGQTYSFNVGGTNTVVTGGAGTDTLVTYGGVNMGTVTLGGIEAITAHSNITINASQITLILAARAAAGLTGPWLTFTDGGAHTLTINNDTGGAFAFDQSGVVVSQGTLAVGVSNNVGSPAPTLTNSPAYASSLTKTVTQFLALVGDGNSYNVVDSAANVNANLAALVTNVAQISALNVNSGTASMTAAQFDALDALLTGNTVNVDATGANTAQITALSTSIAKVNTISNLTLTSTQSVTEITNTLGKASLAAVNAATMSSAQLDAVAAAAGTIATNGITGAMPLTSGQDATELTTLFGKYSGTTATVVATGMDSAALDVVAANTAKIAAGAITGVMAVASTQDATELGNLFGAYTGTTATADATSMVAAQLNVLADNTAKTSGITGAMVLLDDAALSTTNYTDLVSEYTGTTASVTATSMTMAELVAVVAGTGFATKVASITGAMAIADTATAADVATLFGKYTGTTATVNAASMDTTEKTAVLANLSKIADGGITALNLTPLELAGATAVTLDAKLATAALTVTGTANGDAIDVSAYAKGVSVVGGNGGDVITSGAGSDTVYGGAGADVITLATGTDVVQFGATTDSGDVITGFTSGTDVFQFDTTGFSAAPISFQSGTSFATGDIGSDGTVLVAHTTKYGDVAAAATAIENNTNISATVGFFVFTDSDDDKSYLVHTTNLAGNGTETVLAEITGTNLVTLVGTNFLLNEAIVA